jgi:hypothetical protein
MPGPVGTWQHTLPGSQVIVPHGTGGGVVVVLEVVVLVVGASVVEVEVVLVDVEVVGVVVDVVVVVVCAWQLPPEQFPLQHCSFLVQVFPLRLQPGGSADASAPMPSDPSVLPTTAARKPRTSQPISYGRQEVGERSLCNRYPRSLAALETTELLTEVKQVGSLLMGVSDITQMGDALVAPRS